MKKKTMSRRMSVNFKKFEGLSLKQKFDEWNNWLVISHHKPDGDTLGSASAIVSLGKTLGKDVSWVGVDPLPDKYLFLPHASKYRVIREISPEPDDHMLIIALDTSNVARSVPGINIPDSYYFILNIDHHGDNEMYGTFNCVDDSASSTAELLFQLFEEESIAISYDMAIALYTGIMTDTGNFSYDNTSSLTLKIASELVDIGVQPFSIYRSVYHGQSLQLLKLWGRAFDNAVMLTNSVVISWLSSHDFLETGANRSDTENLVSRFLELDNVEFSLLLVEEDRSIRVSLRSANDRFSAREVAKLWGGGGHEKAAGCTIDLPLIESLKTVKLKIKEYVKRNSTF